MTPAPPEAGDYFPLPRAFKQKVKDGLVALPLASCVFMRALDKHVFDSRRYFNNFPVLQPPLLALAANILVLAFLIWAGIGLWRRSRSKLLSSGLELLFLLLLVFPADFLRSQVFGYSDAEFVNLVKKPAVMFCFAAAFLFVLWQHRLVARTIAMVIVVAFPLAALTLVKIILNSCGMMLGNACPISVPPPPMLPVKDGRPRVVWIIFDETDYRLAIAERPASVKLPEFDRLRQQSLSAEKAYAPGDMTIISMPALISGRRVAEVSRIGCGLALTLAGTQTTNDFSTMPTVFSKARELGVNTAVVGWFIPYGRLLGASLNYCAWYGMSVYQATNAMTFGGAMLEQLSSVAWPFHNRKIYISICQRSMEDALPIVTDPKYGLTLLHLPPPHFPGVYLPETQEFTCLGIRRPWSYLNNLSLADHELGVLRQAMENAGQWDKTWIILSADHSWRSSKSYDGVRDFRVPYLVKPPGAGQAVNYSTQFNTLVTHDLILAILSGEITNETDVAGWLDKHATLDMPIKPTSNFSFE